MKNDVTQTTPTKGKPTPKNNEKPGFFKRTGRSIKETFGELKKVTWPTFPTVLKQLGCVLVTVLIMLVLILVIDLGLQQLLNLIRGGATNNALVSLIGEVL